MAAGSSWTGPTPSVNRPESEHRGGADRNGALRRLAVLPAMDRHLAAPAGRRCRCCPLPARRPPRHRGVRRTPRFPAANTRVLTGALRRVRLRIWSLKRRTDFSRGNAYRAPPRAPLVIFAARSLNGRLPCLILYPRNSKPCRTWTIRVFPVCRVTPSLVSIRVAASSAAWASPSVRHVTSQSSAYRVNR